MLDFKYIKEAHKALRIYWEDDVDGHSRIPTIPELRAQAENLMQYCIDEDKPMFETEGWLIVNLTDTKFKSIQIWYILDYGGAFENPPEELYTLEELHFKLNEALEIEDFLEAAKLRDLILTKN